MDAGHSSSSGVRAWAQTGGEQELASGQKQMRSEMNRSDAGWSWPRVALFWGRNGSGDEWPVARTGQGRHARVAEAAWVWSEHASMRLHTPGRLAGQGSSESLESDRFAPPRLHMDKICGSQPARRRPTCHGGPSSWARATAMRTAHCEFWRNPKRRCTSLNVAERL